MWIKTVSMMLWLCLISVAALAQTLAPVIAPPLDTPQAGREMIFPVYYHNSSNQPVTFTLPNQLNCRLISRQKSVDATAKRIEPNEAAPVTILPQGFIKASFSIFLPEDTEAKVQLVVPKISATGLPITVQPPAANPEKKEGRFSWIPRSSDEPMDAVMALFQPYVKNISFYNPMYFLVGTKPEKSKFQVSFKYQFFNADKVSSKKDTWVEGFHLGYTQTSFWNLDSDSAPFEDTSYKPELFFISPRFTTSFTSKEGMFVKTGIQHESNGLGGAQSRSTNFVYLEPNFLFFNEKRGLGLQLSSRIWFYVDNEEENNPDIEDYRGYFNLGVTFGKVNNLVVDTNFQWADKGASVQVDATYPLHLLSFDHVNMYLHVNYSNTLAERLINYTEREEAIRIGFAIVR